MTAAHCADGVFHHEVVIGAHEIRDPSNKIIDAYSPTVHPEWDSYNLANDLAILELEEEIDFATEPNVGTNCLAQSGDFSGQMSLVSGWGRPSDSSSGISEVLRYVDDRRVLTQDECENYWGNLNEGVVCIDTTDGGGSCNVSHLLLPMPSARRIFFSPAKKIFRRRKVNFCQRKIDFIADAICTANFFFAGEKNISPTKS